MTVSGISQSVNIRAPIIHWLIPQCDEENSGLRLTYSIFTKNDFLSQFYLNFHVISNKSLNGTFSKCVHM